MRKSQSIARRGRPLSLFLSTVVSLIIASTPISVPAISEWQHNIRLNSTEYKQAYGYWEVIDLPEEFRTNAIHAAALPTGKVLLVAGSGNNRDAFNRYHNEGVLSVLRSVLFDPETGGFKNIPTPSDLFCSGHVLLQNGNVLIAGGTSGYELLEGAVKKPAGPMVLHNENPDSQFMSFKKGTRFISPTGKVYLSTQDVLLPPAHKTDHGNGNVHIHHSSVKVFVEAEQEDTSYITDSNQQFTVEGLQGTDRQNVYGQGGPMTLNKQDYRGDNHAYEFDPIKEAYSKVGDLKESRWYPSLPQLTDGTVLAVSGLDNAGIITQTTERYDAVGKMWSWGPDQAFPTYPALFRTNDPNVLFFSGSSAGYGPEDQGREPGFWNVATDTFQAVHGLRYPAIVETSASIVLPPAQGSNDGSQSTRIMIAGGGGVGESELVTARTDIIDIAEANPLYRPGPDLPEALRYVNMTVTPWDDIFASGGTLDYRAKGNSYSHKSFMLNPTDNTIRPMADEIVPRGYHSGSILLRDGRILFFGNDPLYNDKDNTTPGTFEQRLELYTPPQLFRGTQPKIDADTQVKVKRGQLLSFSTQDASRIATARLIPPSSSTHVTNLEQRSVAAVVSRLDDNHISIQLPAEEHVLMNGWYMLFVVDTDGIPSRATMVEVSP